MKTLLVFLALACVAPLSAQSIKLSADAKGVVVDGGPSGRIVLGVPTITGSDKKSRKPVFAPSADGTSAVATFTDGFVINIVLSAETGAITYRFDRAPADAASIIVNATLPVSYNEGGGYATNGGEAKPFPGEPGKQLFAQGAFTRLDLITGTGDGLSFTMPASYQQLQDSRIWGTQNFSWIYHYDFLRYPSETSFTIDVAPVKKK
ncbi:MAG: hypothetical protein K0R17_2197 [Rariglobus sp.]|jgi:hypothetical protein|nr:hypothetical protein [Rariglobus sp.]